MKKVKKKRKLDVSKIRGLVMGIVAIGLIAQLIFSSYKTISTQNASLSTVTKQKEDLEKQKANLESELNLLNNDDYVTRYARENYVFTQEGESVIILPQQDQKTGE